MFETQFWFDHQWTFGMHEAYLYTLPFHHDELKDFIDFDQMKSSNSNVFNSLQRWSRIKSIEFSDSFQLKSNLIEQIKLRMTNLTSIGVRFRLIYNLYKNQSIY